MLRTIALITTAFLGSVLPICAQHEKESSPAVYKVEFNVHDGAGAATASKHYTTLIDESRKGLVQAGDRVAVTPSSPQGITYIDLGANIEFMVRESNGKPALRGSIEMSTIVPNANILEPVIRQRKLSFSTVLDLRTPTVIVDERKALTTASQAAPLSILRVEATVTKVM